MQIIPPLDGKNSTIMALRLVEGNFAHHFCTWNFEFVSTLVLLGVKWLEYDTQRRIWHSGKLVADFGVQHAWKGGKKRTVRKRF